MRVEPLDTDWLQTKFTHYHSLEEIYIALGRGEIKLPRLSAVLQSWQADQNPDFLKTDKSKKTAVQSISHAQTPTAEQVVVEGLENILLSFAGCCHPHVGDDIIGYITHGHGISIHRRDCKEVLRWEQDVDEKMRLIAVRWR